MGYQSDSIATVVKRLNVQYFLPAIQREFVWPPVDVIRLFDSIMRGYPIGSFLFWELKPENRERWETYEFIREAKQGHHNQSASTRGVNQVVLVLDGQQRLTSLLVGLKGTYTVKKKYKRWDNPDAWREQRLYLDLFKDPKSDEVEEEGEGIYYGFEFAEAHPEDEESTYWFPVGQILNFDSEDRFYEYRQARKDELPDTVTKGQMAIFERNLDRLYRAIWKDDVISYYTEHDQDYDRVLDIFVRANSGGTLLTKSDLLLSMVTSRWAGLNARDEIYGFVDRLNENLTRKNDLDKDFIMKTCLVLSDLPVAYKVENFNNTNLDFIQGKWESIKSAIERTVDVVNSFGIDRNTLTSQNALIPIAYWLLRQGDTSLRGTSQFEVKNAGAIRRWLLVILLNNVFGGHPDRVLTETRRALQLQSTSGIDFPIGSLRRATERLGKAAHFDEYTIDDVLQITYTRRTAFLAVSLLYDDHAWGTVAYDLDHIFPRALFTPKKMDEREVDGETQTRYQALVNRVGNLQLLLQRENQEKSSKPFEEWLQTRDETFRQRHLIPADDRLLALDQFEEFLRAREALIASRLGMLLAEPDSVGAK